MDNNGKVAGGGYYRVEIIAQLFGVTVRRIQQLTQEGVLPTTETVEGRRYDLVPTIQSYAEEDELLADVLDEIYETFIISAVLAGALNIRDFWRDKDRYFSHSFTKPPKDWIDPSKETVATKTALQTGQKTFKQIAAENGQDWRKQIDDICEVIKYARDEHGIDLGGVILGQKKTDGLYADEEEPPATGQGTAGTVPASLPSEPGAGEQQPGDGEDGGEDEDE